MKKSLASVRATDMERAISERAKNPISLDGKSDFL